jgi:hypothetical protein
MEAAQLLKFSDKQTCLVLFTSTLTASDRSPPPPQQQQPTHHLVLLLCARRHEQLAKGAAKEGETLRLQEDIIRGALLVFRAPVEK